MKAIDRYRNNGAGVDAPPEPTETHIRVVAMFDEMITTMVGGGSLFPVARMLQRMRPAMLRDLATVPESQLRDFVVDLGRRMMLAGDPMAMLLAADPMALPHDDVATPGDNL
jgi:hypothetical protein